MPSALDRSDFAPPRDAGGIRSFGLALLIHAALIAALTWGVNWKRSDRSAAFEAELWATQPQEAAPKLVEPPPAPPPPQPSPPLRTEPAPKAQQAPPPEPKVDIALEQEKKRKLLQQQKAQLEAQAEAKAEKENKRQQELKQRQEEAKAAAKAADDAKKADAKKQQQQAQANAAALEAQRQQNIARAMGMASATGGETAKGTTQTSSGPSASYKGKLAALFKRNITFSNADSIQGNPRAVVQVKVSSSGLIMSSRLTKSSGNAAWDEAVLRAVEKTERIPLDENGKVVADFPIDFGPKD